VHSIKAVLPKKKIVQGAEKFGIELILKSYPTACCLH